MQPVCSRPLLPGPDPGPVCVPQRVCDHGHRFAADVGGEGDRGRPWPDLRSQAGSARSRGNVRVLYPTAGERSARSSPAGKTAQAVLFRGADRARGIEGKAVPLYPDKERSRRLERGDRDLAAGLAQEPRGMSRDEERGNLARGSLRCEGARAAR